MQDTLKTYTNDIDRLLVEVSMAGAMYGLERYVALVVEHLVTLPRTRGAALLAHALAKMVVKDHEGALSLIDQVLADEAWLILHTEANMFRKLAIELKAVEATGSLVGDDQG